MSEQTSAPTSDLFQRPRFYRDVVFHKHTDRGIGWLELFYDLVYVATLIQIGNFASSNLNWTGFGRFLVMLFVVWWAWLGETSYQNRYFVDDLLHRLLVLLQIVGLAIVGLSVSDAFGELSTQFALGYAFVRLMLVLMWVRSSRSHPESHGLGTRYGIGIGGGVAIWVGSIALPDDVRWVAWLIAIVFEIVFFALPATIRATRQWAPDDHHLVERMGIFTIIVLGETFVKILDDAQGTQLTGKTMTLILLLTLGLFALWWLHFSDSAGELYDFESNVKPNAWIYGHLLVAAGLVMFGVAAKKLFGEAIDDPTKAVKESYRLLLSTSVVYFLLGQAAITFGVDDSNTILSQRRRIVFYLGTAAVVAVVGLTVSSFTASQFTTVIVALLLVPVGDAIIQTKRRIAA